MSIAGTQLVRSGPLPPIAPPDAALEPAPHSPSNAATNPQAAIPLPTRSQWNAAGLSLVIHLLMLLVLAALLIPVQTTGSGTSHRRRHRHGRGGAGELVDSVTIGTSRSRKGPRRREDGHPTVDGVPAVEGAMAGSSGSGNRRHGHFDAIASLGTGGGGMRQRGRLLRHAGPGRHGRVRRRHVGQHERRPALRPGRRRVGPFAQFARAVAEILRLFLQRRDLSRCSTCGPAS